MHPFMLLAFVLLAALALTQVPHVASAPDGLRAEAGEAEAATPQGGEVATPKHYPQYARLVRPQPAETVATPNHDPGHSRLKQPPTAETVASTKPDPGHVGPMPSFALAAVTLAADPEPAAPSEAGFVDLELETAAPAAAASVEAEPEAAAPSAAASVDPEPESAAPSTAAFVDADTTLYAKKNARVRAAPSTTANIVTKLAADAPVRAVGRSTDGAWWRVSLASGGIGYVHKVAVTKNRVVTSKPPATPSPVVTATAAQPAPARRNQGMLGRVEETMDWLADKAGGGPAPKALRPER